MQCINVWLISFTTTKCMTDSRQTGNIKALTMQSQHTRLVVWLSSNALVSINKVTLRRARLVLG